MRFANATPRPWVLHVSREDPDGFVDIVQEPVFPAYECVATAWRHGRTLEKGRPAKANAELIVRAVNQHEALLDALKAIRDLCDTPSLGETIGNSIAIRSVAEQAIRAAEGIETNVAKPWEAGE